MASDEGENSLYENFLVDLGFLIKEMALASKVAAKETPSDFADGYLSGFHRVVSLMQQQTIGFGIPLEKIGLAGIDPDEELT